MVFHNEDHNALETQHFEDCKDGFNIDECNSLSSLIFTLEDWNNQWYQSNPDFSMQDSLPNHLLTHVIENQTQCDQSRLAFRSQENLTNHLETPMTENPYQLDQSNQAIRTPEDITGNNMQIPLSGNPNLYQCDQSNLTFQTHEKFTNHVRIPLSENPNHFGTQDSHTNHLWTHSSGNTYQNDQFSLVPRTQDSLTNYHQTYSSGNTYQCDQPSLTPRTRDSLTNHHLQTLSSGNTYQCDQPSLASGTRDSLTNYHQTYSSGNTYQCDQPSQTSRTRDLLMQTKLSKNLKRPYQCNQCKKDFVRKNNLKEHLAVHTKERPFVCCACGRNFKRSSALRKHEKSLGCKKSYRDPLSGKDPKNPPLPTHSGKKLFQCGQCEKVFAQEGHLRLHRLMHSEDCPFACWFCGEGFELIEEFRHHECSSSRRNTPVQGSLFEKGLSPSAQKITDDPHQTTAKDMSPYWSSSSVEIR